METESQQETPTWLSIVTKAKRFSANATVIQVNNNAVHPPKKNKNIRIIEEEDEEDGKIGIIGKSLFIGGPPLVAVLPRGSSTTSSCSSSPSPRLTSCGSTSSAEDDFSSSIAASSFPIMQNITMPSNLYMQQLHQAPATATQSKLYQYADHCEISIKNTSTITGTGGNQDLRPPPKAFNQISVIKSTHSFLIHNPKRRCEEDEPQDLSVKKPKRLPTSSFNNAYPRNGTSSSTDEAEEPCLLNSFEDDDNDDCVQDLSRNNNFSSSIPNNRVGPIIKNSFTHNNTDNKAMKSINPQYIDLKKRFSEQQQFPESHQPNKKKVVASNLICTIESSQDNNSNSNSNFLPSSSYQTLYKPEEEEDHESNELIIVDTTPIPQTNYETVNGKQDAKLHEIRINKEIETKEYLETEIEVKNRRGRKRKDEDQTVGKFDCFLCTFTCIRETVLKNHMIRMHTVKGNRGNNVKCTVCAYSCPTMEQLRAHQESIHGQGRTKETEGILGGITTHSKVAYHSCSHCTKKFRSQSQLGAHMRLIAQKQLWKDLKTRKVK